MDHKKVAYEGQNNKVYMNSHVKHVRIKFELPMHLKYDLFAVHGDITASLYYPLPLVILQYTLIIVIN